MAIYAIWNNKGGVGKSYLTFQISSEYARTHPDKKVLVVDLCPQANASGMLLGGMVDGERALDSLGNQTPRRTISGLKEAILVLKDVEGIGIIYLDDKDIVRHRLVKKVIDAYKSIENND